MNKIKGINMIFVTHSPFILSDIPNANIIKLNGGKLYGEMTQTFGANVYDLLANDFFMKNGFIGEFARQKIEEVIYKINSNNSIEKKDAEDIEKIIDIIGDPFYKGELKRMLLRRTDMQELGIFELEEKIKKLKENKKQENDTDTK
jgi:beta-glucosidase/6-phospho-beta-glucosidase/beta-galactosidase